MSAQAKTAPTASFSALERADWHGMMDLDPQCEPLDPGTPEVKDWRDLAFDARRSISNSERCDSHFMRKVNIMIARAQLQQALEKLG